MPASSAPSPTPPLPSPDDDFAHVRPFVREELDSQSLHFSDAAIQSRMVLRHPDALALEYTRTMMGFLMFDPAPARILMIGLGGGSLAKFCHRHLPHSRLTVVELNPHVIALRERFKVPADGARFRIVQDDGARFIAGTSTRFDVLMIDAFDAEQMPEALGTRRFYDDCADVLRPSGLLVANLHASHPHVPVYIDRMSAALGGAAISVEDHDGGNRVVFVRRGGSLKPARLVSPAAVHLQDAYSRIAHALKAQGGMKAFDVAPSPRKSLPERVFHALAFEVIALLICGPLFAWLMHTSITAMSSLTLAISGIAMLWNIVYNALFDRVQSRLGFTRTFGVRVLHAIGFELGLLLGSVPLAAAWLGIGLWPAFVLDLGLILFFLPYTVIFNAAYDALRRRWAVAT